jgi:fatty acid synthase subunit alpha, fungi type
VVPACSTTDDVDPALRTVLGGDQAALLTTASVEVDVRAVLLKSFGFGQANAEALLVHPRYLLASLAPEALAQYAAARQVRWRVAWRRACDVIAGRAPLIAVRARLAWRKADETAMLLHPGARVPLGAGGAGAGAAIRLPAATPLHSRAAVPPAAPAVPPSPAAEEAAPGCAATAAAAGEWLASAAADTLAGTVAGVGVDVEPEATFAALPEGLIHRNFTRAEAAYCMAAPHPAASFAARWAGKEAVFKALAQAAAAAGVPTPASWGDAASPLKCIEVLPASPTAGAAAGGGGGATGKPSGPPVVRLSGLAGRIAAQVGCRGVTVSLSHDAGVGVAVAAVLV